MGPARAPWQLPQWPAMAAASRLLAPPFPCPSSRPGSCFFRPRSNTARTADGTVCAACRPGRRPGVRYRNTALLSQSEITSLLLWVSIPPTIRAELPGATPVPSKQPRLALTLPDELREVLSDYADAQGKPVATVVVELLVGTIPQLRDLTRLMRALQAGQLEVAAEMSRQAFANAALPAATAQHELEGLIATPSGPSIARPARKSPAKGRRGA